MKLTRQHHREARRLWQSVTVDGTPDEHLIRSAVSSMRQQQGRNAEAVLRCFIQRLAVYIRSTQITVVSADPLSPAQQQQLAGLTGGTADAHAGIRFAVDPAVIGGLRVEKGYQVTDRTIARQLEVLQNMLLND